MEATVRLANVMPAKASISQGSQQVKASGQQGDFIQMLQEKKELAGQPEQQETEETQAAVSGQEADGSSKSQKEEQKTEGAGQEGTVQQEALQQAALMQMAAQITVAEPETIMQQPVAVETVGEPVQQEAAGVARALTEEKAMQSQDKELAIPLKEASSKDVVPKTAEHVAAGEEQKAVQSQKPADGQKEQEAQPQKQQVPSPQGVVRRERETPNDDGVHQAAVYGENRFAVSQPEESPMVFKTREVPLKTTMETLPQDLGKTLAAKLSSDNRSLTVELEPASLGKLTIRLVYEGQRAMVSIMASNPKTLELLSEKAAEIASILKEKTGQETLIYTQQPEQGSDQYKENQNGQGQGAFENQERGYQGRGKEEHQQEFFAQQLRLGLV